MSDLKAYFKLTQKIKELERMRDELKTELMESIDDELVDGNYKAKICSRAKGFNQKEFKEKHPRIYKNFYDETKYEYLTVRQIDKSKAA